MRIATAAAGLAAALALAGCSGDDDSGGTAETGASAAPSATETADTGGGSGSGSGSETSGGVGELAGSWLATTDGKAVALIVTGEDAAVFETGGSVCSGAAGEASGTRTLRLTCTDGSGARTKGTVDSVDADSLTVTWEGDVGEETYQKAEGGTLPPGLPTGGSGS
ncbi:hypothetical protein [Streptomyces sp. NPDC002845]